MLWHNRANRRFSTNRKDIGGYSEDLKRLIEGTGVATEIMAPDQENARPSLVGVAAAVVVVDKSDTELDDQVCSLLREYQ